MHREHGGSHDASNLVLCCSSCHLAHHRGTLWISGTAGKVEVRRLSSADGAPGAHVDGEGAGGAHVGAGARATTNNASADIDDLDGDARAALIGLGWKPQIANAAVDRALETLGVDATLEHVMREALKRCPMRA